MIETPLYWGLGLFIAPFAVYGIFRLSSKAIFRSWWEAKNQFKDNKYKEMKHDG